jgi:hypothetical protein
MALELRNALASEFSQSLPATLLFNYPAVEDIAAFVYARLFGVTERPGAEPVSGKLSDLDSIEELSDEEIDSILARRLGGVQ